MDLRVWWWVRQGLPRRMDGASPAEVLAKAGWMRTVGGHGPYLALFARAGLSRAAVDQAIADGSICELPSARGCTYVLPAEDYALGLVLGQKAQEQGEIAQAKKHLGVTEAELGKLCAAVERAVAKKALDPKQIKDAVGSAVRDLGDPGRKKGMSNTLGLALGRLQAQGRIRRVPTNGRLDGQKYAYIGWDPLPIGDGWTPDRAHREIAERFLRWAAPATPQQLSWFAGIAVKDAKAALAAIGAVAVGDAFALADDVAALAKAVAPKKPEIALVPSLDNLAHLRREVAPLVDEADLPRIRDPRKTAGGALADLPYHAIVDRGRVVGFWEYDPGRARVVYAAWDGDRKVVAAEVARTEVFVRDELGDARSFSLDSPESRAERFAQIEAM